MSAQNNEDLLNFINCEFMMLVPCISHFWVFFKTKQYFLEYVLYSTATWHICTRELYTTAMYGSTDLM